MSPIDYDAPAEVYASRHRGAKKQLFYRRFPTVAEAVQFAIEAMPPDTTNALLEIDEERFDSATIRELYEADGYPFVRVPPPPKPPVR